ncbi:hypothetical protein JTE90_022529 [Oedothorax gibbosus]|uniref:Uncharacterized protein n=1 Tax=Oedothorax gibbosus TaxID=931172 RepID=A0AAV6UZ47_9ARAC|nr:hypothetical protein JTE90_022529 [Oedothorax gibbosus]
MRRQESHREESPLHFSLKGNQKTAILKNRVLIGGRARKMPPRRGQRGCRQVPTCHNLPGSTSMEYGATALVSGVTWLLYWTTLQANFAYDDR